MPVEKLWNFLGTANCQLFGRECARSSCWMFFSLFLRFVCITLRIDWLVPNGFIFAFPYLMQILGKYLPIFGDGFPILAFRLAESVLGRISPSKLSVIIAAHFLGCVLGAVIFKSVWPSYFSSHTELQPVVYSQRYWVLGLIFETALTCIYTCIMIALPDLLAVNRLSKQWLSVPAIPLMLMRVPDMTSTFSPAALYALWYVAERKSTAGGLVNLQIEHLIAPILGAIGAGLICSRVFPDDPQTWRRK